MSTSFVKHRESKSDIRHAPITALLQEISDRLSRIENVHYDGGADQPKVILGGRSAELHSKLSSNSIDADKGTSFQSESAETTTNLPSNNQLNSESIIYPERHPLDKKSQSLFYNELKGLLAQPGLASILTYLPPDDGRENLICTEETFLSQTLPQALSLAPKPTIELAQCSPIVHAENECMRLLGRLRSVQNRIRGRDTDRPVFWIRDYDDEGNYVEWDCVSPLQIRCRRNNYQSETEWMDNFIRPVTKWFTEPSVMKSGFGITPSPWIAPWNRLIFVRGLERQCDDQGEAYSNPWFSGLDRCSNIYLGRDSNKKVGASRYIDSYPVKIFHVSFYAFLMQELRPRSAWSSGHLYSEGNPSRFAEIQCITIQATPSLKSNPNTYWTIRVMFPAEIHKAFQGAFESRLKVRFSCRRSMRLAFLIIVVVALRIASESWRAMAKYVDELLNETDTILSPGDHDLLLFEDSTFRRSRKYFWAIDALSIFTDRITELIQTWNSYKESELSSDSSHDAKEEVLTITELLEEVDLEIAKVVSVNERFNTHLERVKLLRDGLFNASATVEAKTATQLGENVKLLTYVSIFYLPLSFCTSLWSISSPTNYTVFISVMAVIGMVTYLIVWNLQRMVQDWKGWYKPWRARVLRRTNEQLKSGHWKQRAELFDRFEPDRRDTKPTEWYILLALLQLLYNDNITFLRGFFQLTLKRSGKALNSCERMLLEQPRNIWTYSKKHWSKTKYTHGTIQDANKPTTSTTENKATVKTTNDPPAVQTPSPPSPPIEPTESTMHKAAQTESPALSNLTDINAITPTPQPPIPLQTLSTNPNTQHVELATNNNDAASVQASISGSQASRTAQPRKMLRGIITKLKGGRRGGGRMKSRGSQEDV